MDDGLTGRLRETVDGFGHLVTEHVQRSKLELLLGGRTLARVAALALGAAALLLSGDLLLSAAAAVTLAPSTGPAGALLLVGGAHLALGAMCVALAKGRLDRSRLLEGPTGEIGRSLLALTAPGRVGA